MAKRPWWGSAYVGLAIIIVLGTCFRIFLCFHFNPLDFIFTDPWRHWINGGRFPKGAYSGASDPIGYQVFMFVVRKLSFDNRYLVAFSSALLSALMPWTYYRAARALGLQRIPALSIWALILWTPSLLAIYHYFMMETLLLLFDGLALWATARYLRKGGTYAFLLVVFLWSAAVLTKPTVAPLALVCGLWSVWQRRTPWKTIGVAAAMVIVMLIPQSIRSEVALGFVAPFGNPWLTKIQLRSNVAYVSGKFYPHDNKYLHVDAKQSYPLEVSSPSCFVKPLAPFSDWQLQRGRQSKTLVINIDSAYGERDWKNAYQKFEPDTTTWLQLWRENILLFLFSPSWPESIGLTWVDKWEAPSRWIWAPMLLFVLAGNLRLLVQRRLTLLPVAVTCLALVLALQNAIIFEGRYRKPLEPLLILNLVWIVATWSLPSTSTRDAAAVPAEEPSRG